MLLYTLITSLPMMICAFFSVLFILGWNDSRLREQRIFLGFMLAATMLYVCHFVYFNHLVTLVPLTDVLYTCTNLAVYPLYLIYIVRLTTTGPYYRWRWWLLPAVVVALAVGVGYALMTPEEQQFFVSGYLYRNETAGQTGLIFLQTCFHMVGRVIFLIEVIVTVVVGIRLIRRYDAQVNEFYADTDELSMRNIQAILYLMVIISILSVISVVVGRARFTDSTFLLAVPSVLFSVLLFAIGYVALQRRFSIIDLNEDREALATEIIEASPATHPSATLSDATLTERIEYVVDTQRVFLQSDLKLDDLARMMHTNRTYIYQAINQQMGVSFNEFINRKRIAYAEQLLAANPSLSPYDLALQSGFASISSYYRNLKKYKQSF